MWVWVGVTEQLCLCLQCEGYVDMRLCVFSVGVAVIIWTHTVEYAFKYLCPPL